MNYDIFSEFYDINDNGFFRVLYDTYPTECKDLLGVYDVALDVYIMSKISDRIVTRFYSKLFLTDSTPYEKIAHVVYKLFFTQWQKIAQSLAKTYDVFNVMSDNYTETETNTLANKQNIESVTQNKDNAFDDTENASNTNASNNTTDSNSNTQSTKTRTYSKSSTGNRLQSDILRVEIENHKMLNLLDIIVKDVASILTLDIY